MSNFSQIGKKEETNVYYDSLLNRLIAQAQEEKSTDSSSETTLLMKIGFTSKYKTLIHL